MKGGEGTEGRGRQQRSVRVRVTFIPLTYKLDSGGSTPGYIVAQVLVGMDELSIGIHWFM